MITAITVFGILASVCTVGLGLPQLIHQLKKKETGDVNFISFWVFYLGLLVWIIFGTFQSGNIGDKPYIFIANFICIFFYSMTMYFVYYYHKKVQLATKRKVLIPIILVILASIAFLLIFIFRVYKVFKIGVDANGSDIYFDPNFGENGTLIFGFIAPSFTTFAFLPQIIQNFKNKDFSGITPYMPLLYIINNTFWILNFSLLIAMIGDKAAIGGLAWQIISTIIFGTQFIATVCWIKSVKRKNQEDYSRTNLAEVK
ncbi:PQ loop repeat [Metamycoplasma cloacale]|uniref:Uncharacterized protein n=1 Tax=Metamycoplasma cloacale TaxID=92401 RepID=A0A2Z4LMX5_9BACT|nr:PQ-loop domain-containing transporter [Metamycoplasma cloacale]AWX42768.1 hypothetical protein DK849_01670 [Metamycoplasma cloacale]VEU79417.1 PQ loop repeat [Metamycoplasma cloacale]